MRSVDPDLRTDLRTDGPDLRTDGTIGSLGCQFKFLATQEPHLQYTRSNSIESLRMRHIIDIFCLPFVCVNCRRVIVKCRFCGGSISHYNNLLIIDGGYVFQLDVRFFLTHLCIEHNDERYIENIGGRGVFFNRDFNSQFASSTDFIARNPHVLFVETIGFHYRGHLLNIMGVCRGGTLIACDCDERSEDLIRLITEGDNECKICGAEYETFPSFEIFIEHVALCLPAAEKITSVVRK